MSSTVICVPEDPAANGLVWDKAGNLLSLDPHPRVTRAADVAAIVVNRNRADLTDALVDQLKGMATDLSMDVYVIEMGSDLDNLSRHCSLHYEDPDFRGKCFGHNVGLRLARSRSNYRYYWILMNDLVFDDDADAIGELVRIADATPEIALISPTELDSASPVGKPIEGLEYHFVCSPDYLCFLMRADAVHTVGFLNPDFQYCWGAIQELCYKLYAAGHKVAYCDKVVMKHLGGTTYGKAKNTVCRVEYRKRAAQFAARYFIEHYGNSWDEELCSVLPPEVDLHLWRKGRKRWEASLDKAAPQVPPGSGLASKLKRKGVQIVRSAKESLNKLLHNPSELEIKIHSLDPWYYPLKIADLAVTPGTGARQSAEKLAGRVRYRTELLVNELAERYDFSGKRILDLAANCAYWSARYAERGATSLLAVEGRLAYVEQGLVYWKHNNFMEPDAYRFLHGNVMGTSTWKTIEAAGPFDFTLCCGILYHIPDYTDLLDRASAVTREAILVDTRVAEEEHLKEEPGGHHFDAIVETRVKKVPELSRLTAKLNALGFAVERLATDTPVPDGLKGADDYSLGNRVTLLAMRRE
jgi:GT2 family glycosyltransferase